MNNELIRNLLAVNVTISGIYPVPLAAPPESLREQFEYLGEEDIPSSFRAFLDLLPASLHADLCSGHPSRQLCAWDELFSMMRKIGHTGVFLFAERPVIRILKNQTTEYSWGSTACEIFFEQDIEEALRKAINWGLAARERAQNATPGAEV